ncbi:MAG: flagellar filament capping protein FliD [Sedimentisphaerales bacterium]|nr:flagellar filament capping protein FliD [Sedimentisphaerales bacterium]
MGTISSGVGLVSGIPIEEIVTQLLAIDARPKDQLETRLEESTESQAALMKIQGLVMALQLSAAGFNQQSVFEQMAVTTSNEDIMTATATRFAEEGTYRFIVKQLASNHHFVSRGYANQDSSIGTGQISFEIGQGQLARDTNLNFINGQQGFQRGKISITDRAGNSDIIDLTQAVSIKDVIKEINSSSKINVTASVSSDALVITDNNDTSLSSWSQWVENGGSGALVIADIGSGHTAADLGIRNDVAVSVEEDKIVGQDLMYITADTLISDLNDGNGIRGINSVNDKLTFTLSDGSVLSVALKNTMFETVGGSAQSQSTTLQSLNHGAGIRSGTFKITDQNGRFIEINTDELAEPEKATLGDFKALIEEKAKAHGMDISIAFNVSDHITITDNSKAFAGDTERVSHFIIEDIEGHAAADLGIVDDMEGSIIHGEKIWFMESVGDIINAVNNHWDNINLNDLVLGIDQNGNGITVTDNTGIGGQAAIESSFLAEDLGLLELDENGVGRRLISGLNTVMLRSLNGGSGGDPEAADSNRITSGGIISLTDRAGNTAQLDLSNVFTVQDILDAINNPDNGLNITASINSVGNGIMLSDTTAAGAITGNLIISDVGDSTLARNLGIVTDDALSRIDSGNLQLQYISEATTLDDLRHGEGVRRGQFTITDGVGKTATIDLAQDTVKTLEDVIEKINTSGTNLRARINDTGDGLLLYDTSEGDNVAAFKVTDTSGSTAHDLGIAGTAKRGSDETYTLDGSYEFKLDVGGGDGLQNIVDQINSADMGVKASLIHDGLSYRLSFNSQVSGERGNVYFDGGSTNLTVDTLSEGRDAKVILGDGSDEHPLLITSSSNTIEDAIKGTTLELIRASDEPVEISVETDIESIQSQLETFVDAFNALMDDIAEATKFDATTLERGVLFADHTVSTIRTTVLSLVQRTLGGASGLRRLSDVGISFASFGSESGTDASGNPISYAVARTPKLEFDSGKFKAAFDADPEGVANLFTKEDTGFGDYIADRLDSLAGRGDSTIENRLDAFRSRHKIFEQRISYLDEVLQRKEERYYREFYAMEQALASMQAQQTALGQLSSLASSISPVKSSAKG